MGLLNAFADPQFRKDVARGLLDAGNRGAVAGLLGGPVDLATMALRPLGYNVEQPVGGSEWIGQKMQNAGFVSPERNRLAEALAGVAIPAAANRLAPTLFAAEQKAAQNLAAPNRMNAATRGQAGAIVWHGSPHKFDKFDSSKIGTGEGAQAYGHGLYLAESPTVAGSYIPTNEAGKAAIAQQLKTESKRAARYANEGGQEVLEMFNKGYTPQAIRNNIDNIIDGGGVHPSYAKKMNQAYDKGMQIYQQNSGGSLYKVDLPDDQIARMLDWDKPLSQQAPDVREALTRIAQNDDAVMKAFRELGPNAPANQAYAALTQHAVRMKKYEGMRAGIPEQQAMPTLSYGQDAASLAMRQQGIPGIRYLDGGSRGAGAGTSNYVVFPGNENLLRILERNGQALP